MTTINKLDLMDTSKTLNPQTENVHSFPNTLRIFIKNGSQTRPQRGTEQPRIYIIWIIFFEHKAIKLI